MTVVASSAALAVSVSWSSFLNSSIFSLSYFRIGAATTAAAAESKTPSSNLGRWESVATQYMSGHVEKSIRIIILLGVHIAMVHELPLADTM